MIGGFEDAGGGHVQPSALAGQQVVVERFADERVPEAAGVGVEHQDLLEHGLAKRGSDDLERGAGDGGQQFVVDMVVDHGGGAQQPSGVVGQQFDARQDDLGQGVGNSAGESSRGDEFFDVERI